MTGTQMSGDGGMSAQHTLAGFLTAIGVIGLVIASLKAPSIATYTETEVRPATVAISLGSQLQLDQVGATTAAKTTPKTARSMVCSTVYQIAGARVGLSCRSGSSMQTAALNN